MKSLITGGSGILGTELKQLFPDSLHPTHSEMDITDQGDVHDYFSKNEFDVVIHAAAMTNVRQCESEKKLAWNTNVIGTANILESVRTCESVKTVIVITTDKCYENFEKIVEKLIN